MKSVATCNQINAIQSKLRNQSKYTLASHLNDAKEIYVEEKMHKQGAYYGIQVSTELGEFILVYISEKIGENA